jgi:hypothetical protein
MIIAIYVTNFQLYTTFYIKMQVKNAIPLGVLRLKRSAFIAFAIDAKCFTYV